MKNKNSKQRRGLSAGTKRSKRKQNIDQSSYQPNDFDGNYQKGLDQSGSFKPNKGRNYHPANSGMPANINMTYGNPYLSKNLDPAFLNAINDQSDSTFFS